MVELSPSFLPELESQTSWFRRKLGWLVAAAVFTAAAGGGYWYLTKDDTSTAAPAQQQTSTATTGRLVSSFNGTGTASATLTSKLTFQASAKVTAVNAKLGDRVEAGQVLATLDSGDAQRKLDQAKVSLSSAQLKLQDMLEPATTSELASATAATSQAQYQLANAQENLRKAQAGPDADAVATADAAVTQAQQSVTSAQNGVQSSWIALLTAQRNYCTTDNHLVSACYSTDLPLTQTKVDQLIAEIRNPATSAVGTAAQSFITANTAYGNSLTAQANAQAALATAQGKRADLNLPPTALTLQQLQSAVDSANASVLAAQQKYDDLVRGPAATDVAQQQSSVDAARIAVETAQANLDAVVLKAPFSGTITAVGIAVGDTVSAATAAFTITNQDAIRVDLSVQEADFVGLKAGQYGIATFEALSGYEYVVRIIFVNPTPTTTQGVVSYQVQAEILRADQLQDPATQQAVVQTLAAAVGGVRRTGAGANANGQTGPNGAVRTPDAGGSQGQRTPGSRFTPPAGVTPGTGGPGNGGAAGGLQSLLSAPAPTPGMNATVVIVKSVQEGLLLIPTSAVKTQGQQKIVTVKKDDGTTEERTVTTGGSDSSNTAITSGLAEGEVVVLNTTTAASTTVPANQTATTQGNFPGGFRGPAGGANNVTGGVR